MGQNIPVGWLPEDELIFYRYYAIKVAVYYDPEWDPPCEVLRRCCGPFVGNFKTCRIGDVINSWFYPPEEDCKSCHELYIYNDLSAQHLLDVIGPYANYAACVKALPGLWE